MSALQEQGVTTYNECRVYLPEYNLNKSSCVCIFITLDKLSASSCSLRVYTLITIELNRMTCIIFILPFSVSNLDSSEEYTTFALAVTFTFEISCFIYHLRRSEK